MIPSVVEMKIRAVLADSGMSDSQKAQLLQSLATKYALLAVGGDGSTSTEPFENFVLTSAQKPIE